MLSIAAPTINYPFYSFLYFSGMLPKYSKTMFSCRVLSFCRTNLELEQVDKAARKLSSPRKSCFGEFCEALACEALGVKRSCDEFEKLSPKQRRSKCANYTELLKSNQSQQSIVFYKVTRNQSTSSPDED